MLKFALGLTTGLVLGAVGTLAAELLTVVALEESPQLLETFKQKYDAIHTK